MERIVLPRYRSAKSPVKDTIVISSRVCIARNIDAIVFPATLAPSKKRMIEESLLSLLQEIEPELTHINIKNLTPTQCLQLKSDLVITNHFLEHGESYFAKKDGSWIVLPNNKDHIQIFSIDYGSSLKEIYKRLNSVLLSLDSHIHYAYSSEFGFLTRDLSYAGNGLYLSLLVNLVGLEMQGTLPAFTGVFKEMGYTLSPYDGQVNNSFYYLQNIGSFGISELDHIDHMNKTLQKLQNSEHIARKEIFSDSESSELLITQIIDLLQQTELNYSECIQVIALVELFNNNIYTILNPELWQEQIFRLHNHSPIFTHIADFEECNHHRAKLLNQVFNHIVQKK